MSLSWANALLGREGWELVWGGGAEKRLNWEREGTRGVLPSSRVDVKVDDEMSDEKSAEESKLCQWLVISCQNDVFVRQSL
jgi:hypothetical protein